MTNQVKQHIVFHYLLTEIQLCSLILLELNIFLKKDWTKSMINRLLVTDLEYSLMTLLCMDFIASIKYMTAGKTRLFQVLWYRLYQVLWLSKEWQDNK